MFKTIARWFKRWTSYEDGINAGLSEPKTLAGLHVTEEGALALTAVWCAVGTISSMIAGLPLNLYQHLPSGGKRLALAHPLYELLHDSPCPELTKEGYWQTAMAHVLLYGNHYAEIERDEAGRPVSLWLLQPDNVKVARDEELGLVYVVRVAGGKDVYLAPANVFHVAGLASDGLVGHSPIALARESIALTAACERFGAAFFGNSARPAGVLQTPLALSQNARENLRKSWEALHAGSGNVGRTAILEDGVTWSALSVPNEDAQFLQTRQYQINEIARLFNISPVFLHDLTRATWANLETLNRQLVQITLMPWLQKIEGQARMKLLSKEERRSFFVEHDASDLLRADTLTRYQSYAIATGGKPWLLPSEVRADERLDPCEGIDESQDASQDNQPQQENDGETSQPASPEE